jgi:hypothetical protein
MIPCNFWHVNANMRKLLKQSNNFKGKLVGTLGSGQLANEFPELQEVFFRCKPAAKKNKIKIFPI